MVKAKVFQTGRSQAIRLPKEFRVNTDEVYLKKTPEGFLVITATIGRFFTKAVENYKRLELHHVRSSATTATGAELGPVIHLLDAKNVLIALTRGSKSSAHHAHDCEIC